MSVAVSLKMEIYTLVYNEQIIKKFEANVILLVL